eukprot:CAMPEP_0171962016 /NCGR_PEP_ID=MMETSP0993-20121228/166412_1 /TAXON_ID=483369 /ORGANISM="non described non described, Strain CCMP2098" /LENGTH=74 /DNA_ID=CAMNT_0012610239 /DNA_START=24 /DNA_END=244 /DNA_ORIENTATION=-
MAPKGACVAVLHLLHENPLLMKRTKGCAPTGHWRRSPSFSNSSALSSSSSSASVPVWPPSPSAGAGPSFALSSS